MTGNASLSSPFDGSRAVVPWYVWCSIIAITSAMIGVHWDISWHRSIGRDTFWTPAHIAIYICGVLAGISCGYLILSTTFSSRPEARDSSVAIWGFRGPLGAFISAWGGIAMLTSAPFDDWWHGAYGLDVKILSPPHVVLAIGMIAVALGTLVLILGGMNRAEGENRKKLDWLFLYVGAVMVVFLLVLAMEYLFRLYMHGARFYRAVALTVPLILAGISRASGRRWTSTTVAAIYTVILLGFQWILPLFPAEPKLGPVYNKVTHFVPPEFPLLLLPAAVILDLLWSRTARWRTWSRAALAGSVFLLVFLAVQWPFANFLMTPAARNRFFGSHYMSYNVPATSYYARHLFFSTEQTAGEFWGGMGVALAAAIVMTRLGLAWGDWMRRIRR